jgi:hypothetical protein
VALALFCFAFSVPFPYISVPTLLSFLEFLHLLLIYQGPLPRGLSSSRTFFFTFFGLGLHLLLLFLISLFSLLHNSSGSFSLVLLFLYIYSLLFCLFSYPLLPF